MKYEERKDVFAEKFFLFLLIVSLTIASYSLYKIVSQIRDYIKSDETYQNIERVYEETNSFERLRSMNEDFVGWISIDGTKVNYPIVQTDNNDFYLTHNFLKEPDFAGSVFLDFRIEDISVAKNIILYGHNMKNESMFGSLKHFLNEDYYEHHKVIRTYFKDRTYTWEVVAAYATERLHWMEAEFQDDELFTRFIETIQLYQFVSSHVELHDDQRILTLATCTKDDDKRFVIHAVLTSEEGAAWDEV